MGKLTQKDSRNHACRRSACVDVAVLFWLFGVLCSFYMTVGPLQPLIALLRSLFLGQPQKLNSSYLVVALCYIE